MCAELEVCSHNKKHPYHSCKWTEESFDNMRYRKRIDQNSLSKDVKGKLIQSVNLPFWTSSYLRKMETVKQTRNSPMPVAWNNGGSVELLKMLKLPVHNLSLHRQWRYVVLLSLNILSTRRCKKRKYDDTCDMPWNSDWVLEMQVSKFV